MAESDRISPPPRRFVKRTTRVLARSGTFVRIRAGIGYITHTRVMHQVVYEVSTHRPRPTRLMNSSDSRLCRGGERAGRLGSPLAQSGPFVRSRAGVGMYIQLRVIYEPRRWNGTLHTEVDGLRQ